MTVLVLGVVLTGVGVWYHYERESKRKSSAVVSLDGSSIYYARSI